MHSPCDGLCDVVIDRSGCACLPESARGPLFRRQSVSRPSRSGNSIVRRRTGTRQLQSTADDSNPTTSVPEKESCSNMCDDRDEKLQIDVKARTETHILNISQRVDENPFLHARENTHDLMILIVVNN